MKRDRLVILQVFFNLGSLEATLARCTDAVSSKMLKNCSRLLDMSGIGHELEPTGATLMLSCCLRRSNVMFLE